MSEVKALRVERRRVIVLVDVERKPAGSSFVACGMKSDNVLCAEASEVAY
jgi:hypothetical protein